VLVAEQGRPCSIEAIGELRAMRGEVLVDGPIEQLGLRATQQPGGMAQPLCL